MRIADGVVQHSVSDTKRAVLSCLINRVNLQKKKLFFFSRKVRRRRFCARIKFSRTGCVMLGSPSFLDQQNNVFNDALWVRS